MSPDRFSRDFEAFADSIRVELASGTVGPLGLHKSEFQTTAIRQMAPALEKIASPDTALDPEWRRLWAELHRGAGKSMLAAIFALWLLLYSLRSVRIGWFAVDKDQAAIGQNTLDKLIRLNADRQWGSVLDCQRFRTVNRATASELLILSSDVASSYGLTLDLAIADELVLWSGTGMWTSIVSTIGKTQNAALVVLTNPGWLGTWQHSVRELIRTSAEWSFWSCRGKVEGWITERQIEEQKKLLTPADFARNWAGEWVSGGGNALDEADIDAALTLDDVPFADPRATRIGCLDLGLKRDHAGFVLLEVVPGSGRIRVIRTGRWAPGGDGRVDLLQLESDIMGCHADAPMVCLAYDPWNMGSMAQRFEQARLRTWEVPFTTQNIDSMTRTLLEVFREHRIDLFPCEDLLRDLRKLSVDEKQWGYKLTAPRDEFGHADVAMAMCIGLPAAWELAKSPPVYDEPERIEWIRT